MSNQNVQPVTVEELEQFDHEMENTETMEHPDFRSIPDGSYQCEVERIMLTRTQQDEPMLKWQFNVIGPTHDGAKLFKNHLFRSTSLPFLKTDMHTLGFPIQKASEIPGLLESLVGLHLNIRKVTKGDNENIYINSRIAEAESTGTGRASAF